MNTLKTITTILILFCSISLTYAQKTKPSKEETVKYISDLFSNGSKTTYHGTSVTLFTKGVSVSLDWKILIVKYYDNTDGDKSYRVSLGDIKLPLKIYYDDKYSPRYEVKDSNGKDILGGFLLEDDAKRVKNALEHLIEIIQSEPEDDPFAP